MTGLWLDLALAAAVMFALALVYVLGQSDSALAHSSYFGTVTRSRWRKVLFPSGLIRQAGIPPRDLLYIYWPLKITLLCLMPLILIEVSDTGVHWLLLAASGLSGFFTLEMFLWRRRQQRRRRVLFSLSFFVDLMASFLHSGEPLIRAFEQAATFGFQPNHPLSREASLACREIHAGQAFPSAFNAMWQRTGVREIERLGAVMAIGGEVGAPIKDTLLKQADVLREKQQELNRQLLSQKSIMLLFAMVLVGLPMFLVLVVFPASVKLLEVFQLLKGLI